MFKLYPYLQAGLYEKSLKSYKKNEIDKNNPFIYTGLALLFDFKVLISY